MEKRETLSSRLGFILLSAGCAIGLGNVWRFPYIVGKYGGALFVLIYLVFLVIFGLPIMSMEFSVGRASRRSVAKSFEVLEPKGSKWHIFGNFGILGNYLLMMFYTTISGWILFYLFYMIRGNFTGLDPTAVSGLFAAHTANPLYNVVGMVIICLVGFAVCAIGLQKGVEKITKVMMSCLILLLVVLAVRSVTLEGADAGLRFYLMPNLDAIREHGLWQVIYAAMGQAFFTLSLGVGSMAIFGSYISKERRLFGESINVTLLDTFVAFMAGLIIFPACFAFGVEPGAGPGLIFETLPNIFNEMPLGRLWGSLFFVFMLFAALSTVIAVFENIIAITMEKTGFSRKKATLINAVLLIVLSLPCALGFNLLSGVTPLGAGSTILDLEDFIVSNNLLPLGSLVYLLFCVSRRGWGWDNFLAEVNAGKGARFPVVIKPYVKYVLPLIILVIFVFGYVEKFFLK
ncbi:sodium-dependent transporter [Oscillospiraceae bacterium OttesenSCG-928-F05]|nr:sodium-dependent transporter [Oscillospiraceae bacterium OttesenSCG-928-F05]